MAPSTLRWGVCHLSRPSTSPQRTVQRQSQCDLAVDRICERPPPSCPRLVTLGVGRHGTVYGTRRAPSMAPSSAPCSARPTEAPRAGYVWTQFCNPQAIMPWIMPPITTPMNAPRPRESPTTQFLGLTLGAPRIGAPDPPSRHVRTAMWDAHSHVRAIIVTLSDRHRTYRTYTSQSVARPHPNLVMVEFSLFDRLPHHEGSPALASPAPGRCVLPKAGHGTPESRLD
jgi:hypothetical protein